MKFQGYKYAKIYKLMGRKDDKVDHGVIHGLSRVLHFKLN